MRRLLKLFFFTLIFFALIYVGLVIKSIIARPEFETFTYDKRGGTAIVITGAAARIVQEAALLEHLQKTGWMHNVCFISGTSSGALNTVMLNAILDKKFSWERYRSILGKINNDDIFIRTGKSLPVNNEPYQKLLAQVINDSLGYFRIGDLPLNSAISISDIMIMPPNSKTYRLSNLKINTESNPGFNLVEVLVASTAIPILFPSAQFQESFGLPKSSFVDGGFADDHIPFKAVLQYEKYRGFGVDTLIIVSRKSDSRPRLSTELQNFSNNNSRIFTKLSSWIDNQAMNGFIRGMKELQRNYPELAAHTYVYIPDFDENFALLDFSQLKKQYEVTKDWTKTHKPIPLKEYLARNVLDKTP